MSWKPSLILGSLNRDAKPLKAKIGSPVLDSGLT
jgi:hypothetical protein